MTGIFAIMERHREVPRDPCANGKVVFSSLAGGRSMIGAPTPSLKIVLEGEGCYEVDGRTVRVRPGQFLYLDAGAECAITHRSDLVGLCVMLPTVPSYESHVYRPPHLDGLPVERALVLSTRTSAIGRILEDSARMIARDPAIGHELAGDLLVQADRAIGEPLAESRAAMDALKAVKPSTRRSLFERLERARGHLHAHDHRAVTLAELASMAGFSPFHLARYFKHVFGQAPIAYHRALRLERAARLLATENYSLAETAELTGYSDDVALSHAFRRHFGRSPKLWAAERRASGCL